MDKIFSNRSDSIRKAREAFLIQKGRTIDPDGLNIREETLIVSICFLLLSSLIMLFYFTVCLSLIYIVNYFCVFSVLRKYRLHKNTSQCKILIVPEEGWFGQPKYSTPSKNHPTLCRFLLLCSSFYM